ncbi:hypothetical protein E5206_00365 [Arthrobacter sp. PAMC25564]|uniref:aggregation-promoting factor C-terminal-like domain-containing protein n=1 Tax=Arthrobacter sp. PAMC25564 TaxID=2565366 RepID=UPI0010A238A1|nr:hypothetical protein [Arthrobacter sp. PAMC25564]QCB95573.1 hypothetical protein E5206_00365 [Arthrobacter sp. PAMC25564]
MTEFKVQPRPAGVVRKSRSKASRHRAEPAKPASALSRFAAGIGSTGRRAAVVTAACAVLIGVGAAGQAADTARWNASATGATSAEESIPSADPLPKLNFEKVQIAAQPVAPASGSIAPQSSEVKPAEAPAPTPAPAPAAAPAPAPAPPVAVDDPAGAQAYAAVQVGSYGWAPGEMQCLMKLWTRESDWRTTATNASSGAYGVVQALPAEKMASAGADYLTSYRTQINWGLTYVKTRYGSPCGALNFHYANNWY